MIVHQVYAITDADGIVQNVMVCDNYEDANQIARAVYGDEAFAVDCLQYPCGPGDRYHDGRFWHVGEDGGETEISYIPTQEQQVAALQADNRELTLALAEMIGGGTYAE